MTSLRDLAKDASTRSHSPYSRARVGCALETSDGVKFSGCNIENASFGGTVCAERVAIWKAVSEGQSKIKNLYVYTKDGWPPCGLCLQVMTEFASPDLQITIGDESGTESRGLLKDFLPRAFTPDRLKT